MLVVAVRAPGIESAEEEPLALTYEEGGPSA